MTGLVRSNRNFGVLLYLILVCLAVLPYFQATQFNFIDLDDSFYVTNNPHVCAGLTWETIHWSFCSTQEGHWHPLTWLSHALDVQLFQLNGSAHHSVNIFLHALNVCLLFFLLQKGTASLWRSSLAAALFAVHPINVESVAWVSERKNLLCALFVLVTLMAYGWYARKPGIKRYLLVTVALSMALMAKSMAVSLPLLLLLVDYWPLRRFEPSSEGKPGRTFRYLIFEKVPLAAIAATTSMIAMFASQDLGRVRYYGEFSLAVRAENAIVSFVKYLFQLAWPAHLAAVYSYPDHLLPLWMVLGSACLLVGVTGAAFYLRSYRWILVGWLWYLCALVPVIGLVRLPGQPTAIADRYMYIPMIGICVLVVYGVGELATENARFTRFFPMVALWLVVALAATARVQVGYWHDVLGLWEHAIAASDENFMAHDSLASALLGRGRPDEAMVHFSEAARINPMDCMAQVNLAAYELEHGKVRDSIARLERVLPGISDPNFKAAAYHNLSLAYLESGDTKRAQECTAMADQLSQDAKL
jgi:tetratricopeptide (TPR) repeat protein